MSYIIWAVVMILSYLAGRNATPNEVSKDQEKLAEQVRRLEEDITYYKELTKKLSEENMEFRRKS